MDSGHGAGKQSQKDAATELSQRITEALLRERVVPRFVDSYVIENGRHALQVSCIALSRFACAFAARGLAGHEREGAGNRLRRTTAGRPTQAATHAAQGCRNFPPKFLASLARQQGWTAGDALDFQRDLQMYEELLARATSTRRSRKPFEAANHPFVDRCAFLLDSSFMEKARLRRAKH